MGNRKRKGLLFLDLRWLVTFQFLPRRSGMSHSLGLDRDSQDQAEGLGLGTTRTRYHSGWYRVHRF